MKNHLFVTLMLATASLSSFATVESAVADSMVFDKGTARTFMRDSEKIYMKPDFSAISPSGHVLYYRIIKNKENAVEVVDSMGMSNVKLIGDLIIPSTVKNAGTTYNVTSIGSTAFLRTENDLINNHDGIYSVVFPEGIESIGRGAFCDNRYITKIVLPNSLRSIGDNAFFGCSIRDLEVPGENLKTISKYAFYACGIVNLVVKEGVEVIESYAISLSQGQGEKNIRVELPESIRVIEEWAIDGSNLDFQVKELIMHRKKPCVIAYAEELYGGETIINYAVTPFEQFSVIVPEGCAEAYRNYEYWGDAKNIEEMPTGIEESETVTESNFYSANGIIYSKEPVFYSVYDMVGRCLYAGNKKELSLPKGLYIVKTVDKAEKVMVR